VLSATTLARDKDIIDWIAAFLHERKQRVRINGVFSFWSTVISGVSQGSILCPLIVLIYINDMIESCVNGELFLYADDSEMFKHILKPDDSSALQFDLDRKKEWSDKSLVTLNVAKCKVVSYGHHTLIENRYCANNNDERVAFG
jgi:hypothetical protein